jgi:hypothetical protein
MSRVISCWQQGSRAAGQQGQECLAQSGLPLGRVQLVIGRRGLLTGGKAGLGSVAGRVQATHGARDPQAFPAGRGGEPASQRGRIADLIDVPYQLQPDVLGDVAGVGVAQPVPAAPR